MSRRRAHPALSAVAPVAAGALILSACAGDDAQEGDGSTPEGAEQLAILGINDFHGGLANGRELACTVELHREEHPDHLVVSAGDDVGASQFESSIQDDQPTLDLFNALEVDVSALGNHEFDEGYADITDRLEPEAEFDHLAANLFQAGGDERAAEPFQTYEVGDLTVGVVGAVTDETPELVVAEGVADVEFRDPIESVNDVIAEEHAEEVGSEVLAAQEGDLTTAWSADRAEYQDGVWSTEESGHGDERSEQSVLGSLTADFLQDTAEWPEDVAPDFALINAGGIRDDIRQDDADSSEVTLRDAADVMPFNNRMAVVELTGEQIGELLEQQWGEEGYHQLGLSSNLRDTFDAEAEAGERITSITVDGEPVDDQQTYRVGVQEFLADGGDGFTVLTEAQDREDTEIIDTEVWPDHLSELGTLEPDYPQRAVELAGFDPQQPLEPGEELSFEVSQMHSLSLGAPEVTEVEVTLEQGGSSYDLAVADYATEDGEGSAPISAELPEELEGGDGVLVLSADEGGTVAEVPVTVS